MAYTIKENIAGLFPIANTDAGYTPANGSSVIPSAPASLGMTVRANDPTFGDGTFICLLGVANTVVGSVVIYDATTWQTALVTVTNGKNKGCPVAVAMSANGAGTFGWYQIQGNAVVKKTTVAVTPQVPIFISATSGRIKVLASAGQQILGAQTANLVTIVTTTSNVTVTINAPFTQGQIT